jgi:hypothetical protein
MWLRYVFSLKPVNDSEHTLSQTQTSYAMYLQRNFETFRASIIAVEQQ